MDITNKADIYDTYLIKLMQRFNEKIDFDKYYLSYSGGKDSHFLYWFIKEILQDNKIKIEIGIGKGKKLFDKIEILSNIIKIKIIVI